MVPWFLGSSLPALPQVHQIEKQMHMHSTVECISDVSDNIERTCIIMYACMYYFSYKEALANISIFFFLILVIRINLSSVSGDQLKSELSKQSQK